MQELVQSTCARHSCLAMALLILKCSLIGPTQLSAILKTIAQLGQTVLIHEKAKAAQPLFSLGSKTN